MGTDVRGNAHVEAGIPGGGQFSRKLNAEPGSSLVDDPRETTQVVLADDLRRGQLVVTGPETITRWESNQWVKLDGRETAEIVNVERFGRRLRVILERQDGSQTTVYPESDDPFQVAAAAFGKRMISPEQ